MSQRRNLTTNREIAQLFEDIAKLLEIRGDNIHRLLSYRRAGETIAGLSRDLSAIHAAGELTSLPGIGKTLAEKIEEIFTTGKLDFYDRLTADVPESLLELVKVDGLGPKRVKLIYEKLGVTNLTELEAAAAAGKLRELPKMGAKSEQKIIDGIQALKQFGDKRFRLGEALPFAKEILSQLEVLPVVTHATIAGSLRRFKETIGDIDLLVAVNQDDDAAQVMEHFCTLEVARSVALRGPTKSRIVLENGLGVDLRVLPAAKWGTLLSYFTGSQAHNVRLRELAQKKGLSLNEYSFTETDSGEDLLCADEPAVYAALDLPYIPPVLRQGRGEIEAAQAGRLPNLIQLDQIVSDLHMHTTWSDGKMSIREMAVAARDHGLQHIVITDHSYSLGVANGLSVERLEQQSHEIRAVNGEFDDLTVLHGTEMEIRPDGTLDFDDDILAELDFVIAALHVSLKQPREQVTERMLGAIENKYVNMIAHPTGRLIGRRLGADLDMDAIFTAAARTGTILEINANPRRLDLRDSHVRRGRELGVMFAINTDAHHIDQLALTEYGVATAQRGWLSSEQIVNCWSWSRLHTYLQNLTSAPKSINSHNRGAQ